MNTPLVRSLNISGGSFYGFSSASRDLSKAFNNPNIQFVFSKFACLNLPDISKLDFSTFSNYENTIQFDTIDGAIFNGLTGDTNLDLTESLQNYALNLETMLLNNPDYNALLNRTVSERAFFKWLKEIGAIRFRAANTAEVGGSVGDLRYVEEDTNTTGTVQYQRVVEYVGDIDMVNHVQKAGETYTEIYINIPTEVGKTPVILFDALSDDNYQPDLVITGTTEFIQGRSASTLHPENLSLSAFYDYDSSVSYTDSDADWYNQPVLGGAVNSYFTEPTTFDDATNLDIQKYPVDYSSPAGFGGTAYRRSKLDGISIDFDPSSYYDILNDSQLNSIQGYNSSAKATNFEFNAVLVYYDLYDTSAPNNKSTNLYGILFLDNVTPTVDGGYIQRIQKFKPNPVTKLNGNSFGLKINVKFDASVTTVGVDTLVNEYNTFSMGLFVDASTQLQQSVTLFTQQQSELLDLITRVDDLETRMFTIDSMQLLTARMDQVEVQLQNSQLAFASSTTLLDLIAQNSDNIQALANGTSPLAIQYNTDVLNAGSGITVDKTIPNKIKIINKNQEYNLGIPYDILNNEITIFNPLDLNSISPTIYYYLGEYTNMVRLYTENTAIGTIKIYIDDTTTKFKTGQVVRLVFPDTVDINNNDFEFYTDASNRFGFGSLGMLVATVSHLDLINANPILELICLDENGYTFTLDITR